MSGKFVVFTGKNGKHYFHLKAGNGQVILSSQGYADTGGAHNGIASVRTHAADARHFEKKVSSNGKHYFNLKAANGQVIGNSEMYESERACDNGIDSVTRHAADAVLAEE